MGLQDVFGGQKAITDIDMAEGSAVFFVLHEIEYFFEAEKLFGDNLHIASLHFQVERGHSGQSACYNITAVLHFGPPWERFATGEAPLPRDPAPNDKKYYDCLAYLTMCYPHQADTYRFKSNIPVEPGKVKNVSDYLVQFISDEYRTDIEYQPASGSFKMDFSTRSSKITYT